MKSGKRKGGVRTGGRTRKRRVVSSMKTLQRKVEELSDGRHKKLELRSLDKDVLVETNRLENRYGTYLVFPVTACMPPSEASVRTSGAQWRKHENKGRVRGLRLSMVVQTSDELHLSAVCYRASAPRVVQPLVPSDRGYAEWFSAVPPQQPEDEKRPWVLDSLKRAGLCDDFPFETTRSNPGAHEPDMFKSTDGTMYEAELLDASEGKQPVGTVTCKIDKVAVNGGKGRSVLNAVVPSLSGISRTLNWGQPGGFQASSTSTIDMYFKLEKEMRFQDVPGKTEEGGTTISVLAEEPLQVVVMVSPSSTRTMASTGLDKVSPVNSASIRDMVCKFYYS